MNRPEQHPARPPLRRLRALLVLGLLAGLLGMHALAPGGAVAASHPRASTAVTVSAPDCVGEGHCGSGHVSHADTTCASAAVSGGPSLPALVPDPVAVVVRNEAEHVSATATPDGARAPPSLAELQLLRI